MRSNISLSLKGHSGETYAFGVFPTETTFQEVGAVYLFLRTHFVLSPKADVIYVGKANHLQRRLDEHRNTRTKWDEALRMGFNAFGVMSASSEEMRTAIEKDLIRASCPPLNIQHNALAFGLEPLGAFNPTPENALATLHREQILKSMGATPPARSNALGPF